MSLVDATRPDPDALLASIQREEDASKRGRLKIFFGMAPGVGKTYAMLQEARREEARGVDVVVGLVETHGRAETLAMLEGLVIAPRRRVEYRGATLEEMDLDAIIFLRPKLVLVDELAHTNAPGSRHPKRYQDVLELLDLGIDVFTTLNVQHVESRADTVRQLTGVAVHETVPDSVAGTGGRNRADRSFARAACANDWRKEKSIWANARRPLPRISFKEENLVALREIALRLTAERVDQQLRSLRPRFPVACAVRLVRPIDGRGGIEPLFPGTGAPDAPASPTRWTPAGWWSASSRGAACPKTSSGSSTRISRWRANWARRLFSPGTDDVARALLRVARENHVTQLIVGQASGVRLEGTASRWIAAREVDTRRQPRWTSRSSRRSAPCLPARPRAFPAPCPGRLMAGRSAESWPRPRSIMRSPQFIGYWSLALVYLLAILLLGLRLGRGPLLLAAALSAVLWDFLFIPPLYTFYIARFEDGFMLGLFFVVALVTGQLTSRLRSDERNERRREQKGLRPLSPDSQHRPGPLRGRGAPAGRPPDPGNLRVGVRLLYRRKLRSACRRRPHASSDMVLDEKEHGVAVWSYRNRRTAGRFTDTLASSQAFHLPLLTSARAYGVMAVKPAPERRLTLDERDLLESFAQQIAMVLEKESLRAEAETGRVAAQSEELYRSLFNSVSHELQTPLAVLQSGLEELTRTVDARTRPDRRDHGRCHGTAEAAGEKSAR